MIIAPASCVAEQNQTLAKKPTTVFGQTIRKSRGVCVQGCATARAPLRPSCILRAVDVAAPRLLYSLQRKEKKNNSNEPAAVVRKRSSLLPEPGTTASSAALGDTMPVAVAAAVEDAGAVAGRCGHAGKLVGSNTMGDVRREVLTKIGAASRAVSWASDDAVGALGVHADGEN